jgi:hypothetical protein
MQRGQTSDIFCLKIWLKAKNIDQSHFCTLEASPVKGRALLLILHVDVNTSLSEVVNAKSLIFLSSNMDDTCAKLVSDVQISTALLHQKRQHRVIAVLGNVMQGGEVFIRLHVDPVFDLLCLFLRYIPFVDSLLPGILEDDFEGVGIVQEGTVSQETEI